VAPRKPHRDELISIGFGVANSVLAIVYTIVPFTPVLVAWEVVAVVYLVLVFTVLRNRATRSIPEGGRPLPGRVVEYLTWALPIAASATGVTAAVTLLSTDAQAGAAGGESVLVGLLGSVGVILAWLLLQTGFAEVYESVYERLPPSGTIVFPGVDGSATLSDFLYFSFTIGTSFAISGATVASREVRRVVLIQSITSFFYNAFLIAVAIQVIQGIVARS